MVPALPSQVRRGQRVRLLVMFTLLCLPAGCGKKNNQPTHTPPLNGGDPNTPPAATAVNDLLTQINSFRTSKGLSPLVQDASGNTVAANIANGWAASAFDPFFSYDTVGNLNSLGANVSNAESSWAQGYSSAATLFNDLQQFDPFRGPFTKIGIALVKQGAGNVWAIVQF
jgi:hypothetical protein